MIKFSQFGQKFTSHSGILQLMDDINIALSSDEPMLMLGGGNPAHIPEVQTLFRQHTEQLLADGNRFERMIGDYDAPQGSQAFIQALINLLHQTYGWSLKPENIVLTNGSQTAFFCLFNLLAGKFENGQQKKILLPLAPEYIGYTDLSIGEQLFVGNKPQFEFFDQQMFKYRVDFDALNLDDSISAMCVSRPTNPTANVLTDDEMHTLSQLAKKQQIPFVIDGAYGSPFPNIIFTDTEPMWDEHIILCLSLSKLGLPGTRTGIVIADEKVTRALASMNAVMSLAPNTTGAILATDMMRSGQILQISRDIIQPFYQHKAQQAVQWFQAAFKNYPLYIHKPEGAFFLWLWFKDLPIATLELYQRLKQRRVIIVPGEYFFPGLEQDNWSHKQQCIRFNYAQPEQQVRQGIEIIAQEVKALFHKKT
ncbi:valine--pyruvate transaminase [Candidatus Albibeggiatoa sp. nov. BB20]|uniref:valine--pyruvate transaminase n=1 Tax=Candidatus Albibeggiatoa sp. nov. BB20 TaxID=3162723 RepID=UPI0033656C47